MCARSLILLVDDEPNLREMLTALYAREGYAVNACDGAASSLAAIMVVDPDLIVLDVMMPGVDGLQLLPQLRRRSTAPVLMLTALGELDTKTAALDAGADDYLAKPFAPEELLARTRALLRRPKPMRTPLLRYRDVELDLVRHLARRGNAALALSPREFDLLAALLAEQGRVFSKGQLLDRVWGAQADVGPETVDKFVSLLRRKLASTGEPLIHTVHGVGYVLRMQGSMP